MRLAALALILTLVAASQDSRVGTRVPGFEVRDVKGAAIPFDAFRGTPVVVAFISVNCPISNAFNDRLSALYQEYSARGARFLVLNANANETSAEVAEHTRAAAFPFPVYRDTGNVAADLFGAQATPETFVLDREGVVRYHGYIEDSINEARVKARPLRLALEAVLKGSPVPAPETKAFGCAIKRVRRTR